MDHWVGFYHGIQRYQPNSGAQLQQGDTPAFMALAAGVVMTNTSLIRTACLWTLTGLAILLGLPARADVVLSTTRVIYPAQEREVTVALTNDEKSQPRLVQAWIDDGHVDTPPDQLRVPFQMTPPLFRLDAGKSQILRIVYTHDDQMGKQLPTDKESLFWLNILSVPPAPPGANSQSLLKFAIRSRVKLFFRPDGLSGNVEQAPQKVQWKLVSHDGGPLLEAHNPTAYYISLASVALVMGGREIKSEAPPMLAPGATERYVLKDASAYVPAGATVHFVAVDDNGSAIDHTAKL